MRLETLKESAQYIWSSFPYKMVSLITYAACRLFILLDDLCTASRQGSAECKLGLFTKALKRHFSSIFPTFPTFLAPSQCLIELMSETGCPLCQLLSRRPVPNGLLARLEI